MKTRFLNLNAKDFLKSMIVSMFSALSAFLMGVVGTETDMKTIMKGVVLVAISSMLGYLGKNLFTNSKDQFLTKEK